MDRKDRNLIEDEREYFEERAAIYEFEAGFTRRIAEQKAAEDLEERRFSKNTF